MAISKRLRFEILKRDGFKCKYCGVTADEAKIVVDAVTPEALGGSHKDPANLRAACEPCNNGKSASNPDAPLVADVAEDALRWARAMVAAAKEMRSRVADEQRMLDWFDDMWAADLGEWCQRPEDWQRSVRRFLAAGLPMDILEQCVGIARNSRAADSQKWRYMCGVAWGKISDLQERAREIAGAGIGDGNPSPGPGGNSLAHQLLEDLSPGERMAALALACEMAADDSEDVESAAVINEFYTTRRDREQLAEAAFWFLDHHPEGQLSLDRARAYLNGLDAQYSDTEVARIASLFATGAVPLPAEVS